MSHTISIIIPVLNEAKIIGSLIEYLSVNASTKKIKELIIVDGGSKDNTKDLVSKYEHVILLNSEKGRAKQMNLGAQYASGDILYFLHADSFPPKKFDQYIINEVANKSKFAGCFKMKFNSNHWWLQLAGWLTQFSWRACRGGDQSQFITKSLFEKLNGFNEKFIVYEDNDLINRLYQINQFVVIQHWLTTSARRYNANGIWKLQYHFWVIYVKKWFGASADKLYKYYLKHIA